LGFWETSAKGSKGVTNVLEYEAIGYSNPKGANLFANSVAEIGEAGMTLDSDVKTRAWDFPLSFLGAIMGLQKFTSKEIRNKILRSINIFNIKIKCTQNSLLSCKNLF
jgi:hypothetical protein